MTTSQNTFLTDINDKNQKVPAYKLAYFQERLRNQLYDLIVGAFHEKERAGTMTRADLARRIDKDPAQITKFLSSPGNWTLDTISDLALGIDGAILDISLRRIKDIRPRNTTHLELLEHTPQSLPPLTVKIDHGFIKIESSTQNAYKTSQN